jgi:hypothetical protein
MAYTIEKTNNTILTVVEDGTIDNTTDLKLVGKNYSGYGEIQNENFVALLENFASANNPPRPVAGQLYFDTNANTLKVYDGNAENIFVPLANLHQGALPTGVNIAASNVKEGDIWWDDTSEQLYVYNGSQFVLVGPKAAQDITTDMVERLVYDNLLADPDPSPEDHEHRILIAFADDNPIYIISNDEFTLDESNSIAGFDRIRKGITLVNTQIAKNGVTTDNFQFHGTSSDANRLGGVLAQEYVERNGAVFTSQVSIDDDDGIIIGGNNNLALRIAGSNPELLSNQNGALIDFKVTDNSGSIVSSMQLDANGIMPAADDSKNIGSSSKRWDEVHAVNFKGIADNSNQLLSDGEFRTATKSNTNNTIVRRDSVGDIFATKFRGVAEQADDATQAATLSVSDLTETYFDASVEIQPNKIAARDSSGNINANQFNGLATRSATIQVPTGTPNVFDNRSASVADQSIQPDTVAVRDNQGRLHAAEFIGTVIGGSSTAQQLATPRSITLSGDIEGTADFDGSENIDIVTTARPNSVALGSDTTGNYVQKVEIEGSETFLNIYANSTLNGPAGEGTVITMNLNASASNLGNTLVARDAQGSVSAENIDAKEITASTRLNGAVNTAGTTNDGFFDNLTVNSLSFAGGGSALPISVGGTGAVTAAGARTNLDVYSTSEVDSAIGSAIGGVSTTSIVNGSSQVSIPTSGGDITVGRAGGLHSRFTSDGIELSQGKFVGDLEGNAASANYADLAELYTTDNNTPSGTVVMVSEQSQYELEPCDGIGYPVGVVSTNPAFLMNKDLDDGTAIALKGRVPTRVVGAVSKGDLLFAGANGCAHTQGVYKIGVALESSDSDGESLIECMLVM